MTTPKWLPGVRRLTSYRISWLRRDVVAGIVLSTLLVPQGMAYAELAGLPPITGLYTTVLCLIGYAVFGPSRILVLGPDSSLGPMIAATILPILGSNGSPEQAIALASILALMVGAIMIVAGIAKLGFVADLLSKPTQIGYMNGLALTILIGQLPKLFGFSTDANGLINEASAFVHGLASGEAVGAAVAIGLVSLGLILVLGRWLPRIPGVLVAVLVAIAASRVFDLASHGVSLVGPLPQGFPPLDCAKHRVHIRSPTAGRGSAGDRTRRAHRHHLHRLGFCCPHRAGDRRQRRDDRDRCRERRRQFLPGIPGQHERVANRSRRASRRQDAGHWGCRSRSYRADAGVRALAAAKPPPTDTRRCRDSRITLAGRHPWNRAALASAARRVPALDHGISWCGAARRPCGHRGRRGALDLQRLPTSMVAVPDHTRPRPRVGRPSRSATTPQC